VDIAFAVVPTILGFGAAGLIGSSAIRTAKDVMSSISVLRSIGPVIGYGGLMAGKGLGKGLRIGRDKAVEKWPFLTRIPYIGPILFKPPKKKGGENQDTQGKQDEKGGGGSGGGPPVPPGEGSKIILPEDLLKSGKITLEEYLKLLKKLEK